MKGRSMENVVWPPGVRLFAIATIALALFPVVAPADLVVPEEGLTGTLTAAGGEIISGGGWVSPGVEFTYEVTWTDPDTFQGPLHYKYTFENLAGTDNLSHLNIEVSEGFDPGHPLDYSNGPLLGIDEWGWLAPGSGNPGMPEGLYALKFDVAGGDLTYTAPGTWVVEFDSWRTPVMGDFYAKDGTGTYAYNSGFGTLNGAEIVVPDGSYVPVPGAVLLGLLGLGYSGTKLRKRV